MAWRDRPKPALYELMKRSNRQRQPIADLTLTPTTSRDRSAPAMAGGPGSLENRQVAGRPRPSSNNPGSPRAGACLVAVMFLGAAGAAYWAGYRQGQRETPAPIAAQAPDRLSELAMSMDRPAPRSPAAVQGSGARASTNPSANFPSGPAGESLGGGDASDRGWAQVQGVDLVRLTGTFAVDPRETGLAYYVLLHTNAEYAGQAVRFLWEEGVEAAAVRGHNERFFRVIALKGFTAEELNGEGRRQYQKLLQNLGRSWESRVRGAKAWNDLYHSTHKGAPADETILRRR